MTEMEPKALLDCLSKTQFFYFVWRGFDALHAGADKTFHPAWHVRAICHELDQIYSGANKRLVINVPPRHLKSVTVSVAFTAFILGHDPSAKIIVASYGMDLARLHSEQTRKLMMTDWYRAMFPETCLSAKGNTVDEVRTTKGGSRKAVSTGGAVTGHGADYIIIDDLLKAADGDSDTERQRACDYIDGSLLSRFDNPREGKVVMIAQRLHELDPPGFLLEKGTYRHLNLRAIAEEDEEIPIGGGLVHKRARGEALFPEHADRAWLEQSRKEMGSVVFNCQYQQNPIAPDGSPLKWEWFKTYEERLQRDRYQLVVQSWDTGMSANPTAACSVCTTWGFTDNVWHLLDVFRDRLDYPDLLKKVRRSAEEWRADEVIIEKAATGIPLLHDCRREDPARFLAATPYEDKEIRFNRSLAVVEAGKIYLPREAEWLPAFKRELQAFPRSNLNDQVDSFSQFINWSQTQRFISALGRDHPINVGRREKVMARREQRQRR